MTASGATVSAACAWAASACRTCTVCAWKTPPTGNKIIVNVPGIQPEQIKISTLGRIMVIDKGNGDGAKVVIPDIYDLGSIKADMSLGVLTVTIDRLAQTNIAITVAGQPQLPPTFPPAPEPEKIEAPSDVPEPAES